MIAWGDEGAIRKRIEEHWQAGADHVCVQPISAMECPTRTCSKLLAPTFLGGVVVRPSRSLSRTVRRRLDVSAAPVSSLPVKERARGKTRLADALSPDGASSSSCARCWLP